MCCWSLRRNQHTRSFGFLAGFVADVAKVLFIDAPPLDSVVTKVGVSFFGWKSRIILVTSVTRNLWSAQKFATAQHILCK